MKKETLKQYRYCKKRLHELNEEIEKYKRENTVRDSVQGSQKDYPYIMRTSTVFGCPDISDDNSELYKLYCERNKCKSLVREVSVYIHSIDDAVIRRAMILRYMDGDVSPKWDKIAMKIGGGNKADGIRMAVSRFIEKS